MCVAPQKMGLLLGSQKQSTFVFLGNSKGAPPCLGNAQYGEASLIPKP